MMKKVVVKIDPTIEERAAVPAEIRIETTDGLNLNHKVNKTRGHPTDFSMEDTVKKFRKCIEYTKQDILEKRIDEIINVVLNIEDTPIELLTNLLCLR
jgi:2-methylcitrate dehydratase PrpD